MTFRILYEENGQIYLRGRATPVLLISNNLIDGLKEARERWPDDEIEVFVNDEFGELLTWEEYKEFCKNVTDYDGYGDALDENYKEIGITKPSTIEEDSKLNPSFVLWYNR